MSAANDPLVTRRLAAILIADVVGYSRLMERDDTGTFSRLRLVRDEVVDPTILSHGGRIVKTAGDGLVAEFSSALAALRAAVIVQREMATRNLDVSADGRIDYRIGINLGDVMVDGNDLAGDGINVAARLESLADPGGICVSGSVREQVHGSLDVGFDDIGERQVKNIARPIQAFAVRIDAQDCNTSRGNSKSWMPAITRSANSVMRRLSWPGLLVAAATLIAIGVLVASSVQLWPFQQDRRGVPPALSVGIMPLSAQNGDSAAMQRVESLTRDLSASLTRAYQSVRVVPVNRGPSDTYGKPGVGEIARTFNVRYLLEGSAQTNRDETAIRLRLIDGTSGEQVWSEDLMLKESVSESDRKRLIRTAMERLGGRVVGLETQRVVGEGERATAPMDYVLRAWALGKEDKSLDRFHRQEALFDEALRRDPDLVPALLGIASVLDGQNDLDSNIDRERLIKRMDDVTRRAVILAPNAAEAWDIRSGVLMNMGRWDAALEASEKAIKLDPDAAYLLAGRAWSMSMIGRPTEALALVAQAVAMDPGTPWWTIRAGCEAHLLLGQYQEAITTCERAAGRSGEEYDIAYFLAAAYAQTGALSRAREEAAKILRRSPGFTITALRAKRYSTNPDYVRLAEEHWYSGLRKAGIPEK